MPNPQHLSAASVASVIIFLLNQSFALGTMLLPFPFITKVSLNGFTVPSSFVSPTITLSTMLSNTTLCQTPPEYCHRKVLFSGMPFSYPHPSDWKHSPAKSQCFPWTSIFLRKDPHTFRHTPGASI